MTWIDLGIPFPPSTDLPEPAIHRSALPCHRGLAFFSWNFTWLRTSVTWPQRRPDHPVVQTGASLQAIVDGASKGHHPKRMLLVPAPKVTSKNMDVFHGLANNPRSPSTEAEKRRDPMPWSPSCRCAAPGWGTSRPRDVTRRRDVTNDDATSP